MGTDANPGTARGLLMEAMPIKILIGEDHLIARAGLSAIINAQPDMTVVAEANNGRQAIALYRQYRPDVTLMDMRMPITSGYEAASKIRKDFPDARIVALSTYGGDEDIRRAFLVGVRSYLTKDVLHDELIHAIRVVHGGGEYLPDVVAAVLAVRLPRTELSARELEVLDLIVQGFSNKQIAFRLTIAEHTVKNHVKSILSKLHANDRTEAATAAIRRGIVRLETHLSRQDK